MKKLLFVLIFPFLSFGQGWEVTIEDNIAWSVQETSDNGFIASDVRTLYKFSQNGQLEWSVENTLSNKQLDWSCNLVWGNSKAIEVNSGGFIHCACSGLTKYNENGIMDWYTEMSCIDIVMDNSGKVLVLKNNFTNDTFKLQKIDENGETDWSVNIPVSYQISNSNTSDTQYISSMKIKQDNSCVIAYKEKTGPVYYNYDECSVTQNMIKINENGDIDWIEEIGLDQVLFENCPCPVVRGAGFDLTNDGGYILSVGNQRECCLCEDFDSEYGILKLDQFFQQEWIIEGESARAILQTNDGGYAFTQKTFYESSLFLKKYNEFGEFEWIQEVTGIPLPTETDVLSDEYDCFLDGFLDVECEVDFRYNGLQQVSDGGYIMTGTKSLTDTDGNETFYRYLFLVKTDSEGNVEFTSTIELPNLISKRKLVKIMNILGGETSNNKGFQLHIYDDGSVEKKYIIK